MGPSPDDAVDVVRAAERIATSAMRLLGARRARLVWRLEPDPAAMTGVTIPAEDTLSEASGEAAAELAFGERARREGRALCTPDVLAFRDLALAPAARTAIARGGLNALAAVPIPTAGAAAGSLVLATLTGQRFTESEMVLLSSLAEQMALVLENARLGAALARQRHESEELARVARLVSERLDVAAAGQRIADGVLGLLGVHSSAIRLLRADGRLSAVALGGRPGATEPPATSCPPGSASSDGPSRRGAPCGPATSAPTSGSPWVRRFASATRPSASWPAPRCPCAWPAGSSACCRWAARFPASSPSARSPSCRPSPTRPPSRSARPRRRRRWPSRPSASGSCTRSIAPSSPRPPRWPSRRRSCGACGTCSASRAPS